jgi:hypothetical protein
VAVTDSKIYDAAPSFLVPSTSRPFTNYLTSHTHRITRRAHGPASRSPPSLRRKDRMHCDKRRDDHRTSSRTTLPRREVRDRANVPQDANAASICASRLWRQGRRRQRQPLAAVHAVHGFVCEITEVFPDRDMFKLCEGWFDEECVNDAPKAEADNSQHRYTSNAVLVQV